MVPGLAPSFSWPAAGEGAVAVAGVGLMSHSTRSAVVPIASLTKMMTAYLVLADHPLSVGEDGPTLTMTAADVADWVRASQTDESNVPVKLGEVLSERQLLEALLLPSGDNIADTLGIWDAGSDARFVRTMNTAALSLGLTETHYADTSGVNPASRSTASDQAVLAALLMENPVVRSIVSNESLPFPVAGTIVNYNPALGVDGVIGVKSGYTSQALGCLATAAYRTVGGHRELVVAVSLGQPGGLPEKRRAAERVAPRWRSTMPSWPLPGRSAVAGRIGTVSIDGSRRGGSGARRRSASGRGRLARAGHITESI